ncbi:alcohol dehydrogenase (acceptor) [Roseibium sp. TrichSKD4]|uniref:GMC family oxidoreductase n=1 Tax=Roseibium sp. TrichSKD4 TaxID=744980 RepID=UPI0001E5683C|nr:GMC oxidoreductase [Roseibium sp. TrichSKD4]EFO31267.1 alcohol dehydrogenase (acceptor) [Roseibium sp. TrichSKD4]
MKKQTPRMGEYDYVVLGAGAAGSIVAARLSEGGKHSVCVLEAGPSDLRPYVRIPAGFVKALHQPRITWGFKTEPTERTVGRAIDTTQGRVVGGVGSINGMVYNRGHKEDFALWEQMGNRGWGWEDVLPLFRRTEARIGPGTVEARGRDGGVPVTDMDWFHPVSESFVAAAQDCGLPLRPDYNDGGQNGVGYFQRTIQNGLRASSAAGVWAPALKRLNIRLLKDSTVQALTFDGLSCTGVRFRKCRGSERSVTARREVILSAGTVNTARLLQISGIGNPNLLKDLGVPVVHALPGVGENLADHYSARMVMRAKPGVVTLNELARGPRLLREIGRWAAGRPNILSHAPSQVFMFTKSDPALDLPDTQCVFMPGSYKEGEHYALDDYPGVTGGAWQHRPLSRGFVRATSRDPEVLPIVQPNYLEDPVDRHVMVKGMQFVREVLHTPRMAQWLDCETVSGPDVQSDDEMLNFCQRNGSTGYHLIGTAKLGPAADPTAVVDDTLRVHGLEGLRVADASIMPSMISANTYATSMMIGEKAADLVKAS